MQHYRYVAIKEDGSEVQGNIRANDTDNASQRLRNKGLYVVKVEANYAVKAQKTQEVNDVRLFFKKLKSISGFDKVFLFRQLAMMLRSGLTLLEALMVVKPSLGYKLNLIVSQVSDDIQSGQSFSQAMAPYKSVFGSMAQYMIQSAEISGELPAALARIADDIEKKALFRRQLIGTMTYPVIIILLSIGLFVAMVTLVIPKFKTMFRDAGRELPALTQAMLDISDFFTSYGFIILAIVVMVIAFLVYMYKTTAGKFKLDKIMLKLPLIGTIAHIGAMTQICWNMSVLLKTGVPLIDALDIVAKIVTNSPISRAIVNAKKRVLEGKDLGSSLQSPFIDPLVVQMTAVGERSGNLEEILDEAADYFSGVLEAKNKILATIVEPISIIIVGGMVAFVYIAFFLAILKMTG